MIEEVHILVDHNRQFISGTHFTAWEGFTKRGRDVHLKTMEEFESLRSQARPEILVFGGVYNALAQLDALGCEPTPLDYPPCLEGLLHRRVERATLGEIRARYREDPAPPIFIKPVTQKRFTGHVVSCFRDLLRTVSLDSSEPLYTAPVVTFLSEWRCYIHKGEVVGIGHYKGDPLRFPCEETIQRSVRTFTQHGAPIAYGMDLGVVLTQEGEEEWEETILVEVNDMIALGCYGLPPLLYSQMIEDRWCELVGL